MVKFEQDGIDLEFETSAEVFSPTQIDRGTLAMISQVEMNKEDKLLDLGCGYGFVGIYASSFIAHYNITMCDISDKAISLSLLNAKHNNVKDLNIIKSDGLSEVADKDFTLILSNPPYHVDFSVPKRFIEQGYIRLVSGGKMYMVTKRKDWYKNKFISVFGGVKIQEIDGYYVFMAQKLSALTKKDRQAQKVKSKSGKPQDRNHLSKKLQRKVSKRN